MEWLANALMGVENVYLESKGANSRRTLINGAVIRFLDGDLHIGGVTTSKSVSDKLDVLLWCTDDSTVRIRGLEVDVMKDGDTTYFNGRSKTGVTKVLYMSSERDSVRVELSGTL